MSKCSVCKTESSTDCQKADWTTHKKTCNPIDFQDKGGNTELIKKSCNKHDLESVRLLIKNGANLDLQNTDGMTALQCACLNNNSKIAALLIEAGASLDIQNAKNQQRFSLQLGMVTRILQVF
jgi:ankyrin repeat protein